MVEMPKCLPDPSLVPERLDGRELARLIGGDPARDEARHGGDADPDDDEGELDLRRENLVDGHRDQRPESDAEDPADRREERRLEQELPPDVAPPRAESAPHADLFRA